MIYLPETSQYSFVVVRACDRSDVFLQDATREIGSIVMLSLLPRVDVSRTFAFLRQNALVYYVPRYINTSSIALAKSTTTSSGVKTPSTTKRSNKDASKEPKRATRPKKEKDHPWVRRDEKTGEICTYLCSDLY